MGVGVGVGVVAVHTHKGPRFVAFFFVASHLFHKSFRGLIVHTDPPMYCE